MSRLATIVGFCLFVAGCSSVFPSARLAQNGCEPTAEALARVKYEEVRERPGHIEISCAGCDAVYVAAQHRWLRQHYPGRVWTEHYTANPIVGADESARSSSCFIVPKIGQGEERVCFSNTEWCDEN